MLKKALLYIVFLLFVFTQQIIAQCPVSVDILPDKTGDLCRNTLVSLTAQPTNGGITPEYFWIINGDSVGTSANISTSVNGAVVELIMISSSGCAQDSAYTSYYISNISIEAEYMVPEPEECNQPKNDVAIVEITGGTEPYSYYLHTDSEDLGQSEYYSDLSISNYPLVITDAEGCTDTTWISLSTKECDPIVPAEIVTPNGDGMNDVWYIQNIKDYPKNKVYIFDRWGQRVYYKEGYDNNEGWDVKYLGSNMPVSTYYYIIELEFDKQDTQVFKGPVSVLR